MNISKITSPVVNVARKTAKNIGTKYLTGSSAMSKINKFVEPKGFSMAHTAFIGLVCSCVVLPRLLNARDKDEKREIFTRDLITIATMLLAMKAIRGGLANSAGKKAGLILTENLSDNKAVKGIKKFWQHLNPLGGIDTLSRAKVESIYSKIDTKESLNKFLSHLDDNGGDSVKALKTLFTKTDDTVLQNAGKKLFGENLENLSKAKEIVKNADSEALAPILKSLNSVDNPLVKTAKSVNALLEAGALGTVVSFLGFGLPAINEKITAKVHEKDAKTAALNGEVQTQPQAQPQLNVNVPSINQNATQENQTQNTQNVFIRPLKVTEEEYNAFKQFMTV